MSEQLVTLAVMLVVVWVIFFEVGARIVDVIRGYLGEENGST